MAFRNISVLLTANSSGLNNELRRASSSVDDFGRRTTTAGRNVTRAGNEMTGAMTRLENVVQRVSGRALAGFAVRALGVYAAGRAVNQALQAIIGGAVEFDTRMRNVNSISGLTERQLQGLGHQVLDLSTKLPQSANNLAEGLYDIASSGFQGAAGITVLSAAARAATAGLTDTATSAAAIAGVLNAYGKGAADARNVSDSLFQTVNLGVLSFGDLAQGIGQVVGTAAAAGVSIDDLGQAIATMTKAGIVPAEAFTSANQLLSQLIQPSAALAGVFKQLGYESGASALKAKGLSGVMEDIRKVTGGDITTMSGLFTDIRSLRGALALTTNQGRLYLDVQRQWGAAHRGAGATATALAEQMKAVSAQWDLYKNRIRAAAIESGSRLLPALLGLMRGTADLGHNVDTAVRPLEPTFHNIAGAIVSTVHVIGTLASAAAPLVKTLALLAVTPVVATLEGLSRATASVTGFFERNRIAMVALATVLTVALLPALIRSIVGFAQLTASLASQLFLRAAYNAAILSSNIQTIGLAGIAAGSAITLGIGAAMYLFIKSAADSRRRAAEAAEAVKGLAASFNSLDPSSLRRTTAAIDDWLDAQARAASNRGGFRELEDTFAAYKAATEKQKDLADQQKNTNTNVRRLADSLGVSTDAVRNYAAANDVDLSKSWDESGDAVDRVRQGLTQLAADAGTSLPALSAMTEGNVQAMQDLADAIKKAGDAAAASFANATDVLQQFKPDEAAQTVTDAQQRLLDARKALREEEAQYNAEKTHSVSSNQQLAHAQDEVTAATKNLTTAQAEAKKSGDLATIYRNNIEMGQRFVTQINEAIRRGLNPQEVARLLQAGPEAAAPVLDQLVSDHSNRLIRLANASERTLGRISEQAVRIAQFTARAINAPLAQQQQLAHDLPQAIALQEQMFAKGGKASLRALLNSLHLSPSELARVAREFGITLPKAIQAALDKHPVHVRVGHSGAQIPGQKVVTNAEGGHIRGPGTATSDSIPALLSNGEFVVKARAVDHYGSGVFAALNKMTLPRYAEGGVVGAARPFGGSGQPVIVRVIEQPTTYVTKRETHIGEVRAHDYRDFRRQLAADARVRAVL